jgi:molybdopterin/thiamine biosynthesis adenylyltransferase
MNQNFDYATAFSRNIGWVTEREQEILRQKRIAIAGMGGVGGFHLMTLARLGIGKFNITDLDTFELANFNRQVGATLSSLNRPKVEVLAEMARDINPEAAIRIFPEGVSSQNLADFFDGADLYIDGLDFFAFQARELVFEFCQRHAIPAITAAPLGMSAALLSFLPGKMSFEDYFGLGGKEELEKAIYLLVGLAPALLHRHYLADKRRVDLKARKAPSTVMACQLSAGMAATEALKILLGRGRVWAAPHGFQFDSYSNKLAHTWRPGGNRHPMNRLAIAMARRQLGI